MIESTSSNENLDLRSENIEEHTTNESESLSTDSLSPSGVQIPQVIAIVTETMQDVVSGDQLSMPVPTFETNLDDLTDPSLSKLSNILRPRSFETDEELLASDTDIINTKSSSSEPVVSYI